MRCMLNNESIAAPQASQQLRRACRIMWRLQHGISPKTTKGPFVLCPCHCSFKTSAMPRAHPSSLILHHSSSSSITDPSSFTWLPHPSSCHRRWPSITDPSSFTWLPHMASSSFHLFAQRRSETLHISGQYLDAGVNRDPCLLSPVPSCVLPDVTLPARFVLLACWLLCGATAIHSTARSSNLWVSCYQEIPLYVLLHLRCRGRHQSEQPRAPALPLTLSLFSFLLASFRVPT